MRFRSELLQPPSGEPEPVLKKIYDVYRSPDGHIAGDDEDSAPSEEDSGVKQQALKLRQKLPK